jgi:hypothetical protein
MILGRADLVSLLSFAVFGGLVVALLATRGRLGLLPALVVGGLATALHAVLCRSARYLVGVRPLVLGRLREALAPVGAAALVAGGVFAGAILAGSAAAGRSGPVLPELPVFVAAGAVAYLLAAAYHSLTQAAAAAAAARSEALAAELLAREAEQAALLARVSPHFLFNSLNSIAVLAGRDGEAAQRMCLALADHLRHRLAAPEQRFVPLAAELQATRGYLDIERVRFSDRLRVEWRVDAGLDDVAVPPLLLQPLVENALKHGVALREDGGVIEVRASASDASVTISVQSPLADQTAPARSGRGLALVRERLALLYGGAARLDVERTAETFQATLVLPRHPPEAT